MRFDQLITQKFPKLKQGSKQNQFEGELAQLLYLFRKEFGLSHRQLMDEPWPAFQRFGDEMKKWKEIEKEERDKLTKRKR